VVGDLGARAGRVPRIQLDLQEPLRGRWDAGRLEQVVSNLVGNAIKFGAGTPVDVRLAAEPAGDVVLTVADRGPGIEPADLPHVFDRFFRADVGAQPGGLGLGLAVVRELVEAMGGSVSASSSPGHGATFTVRLPAASRPPAAADACQEGDLR
jgi:signal transduction histidine kinase